MNADGHLVFSLNLSKNNDKKEVFISQNQIYNSGSLEQLPSGNGSSDELDLVYKILLTKEINSDWFIHV